MVPRTRWVRVVQLAAVAGGGLLGGHALGYLLLVPGRESRRRLLLATGHAYLPHMVLPVAAAGACALLAVFVLALRESRRGVHRTRTALSRTASRLALVQAPAFVGLEILERLAAHAPLRGLSVPLLAAGLVLQAFTACAGAAVLVALERAGRRAGRAPARRSRVGVAAPVRVAVPENRLHRIVRPALPFAGRAPPPRLVAS